MRYHTEKISIPSAEQDKINKAIASVTVKIPEENLTGSDEIKLTKIQLLRLHNARVEQKDLVLKLNKGQLSHDDDYVIVQVKLSDAEKAKMNNLEKFTISLTHEKLVGNDTILVTKSQFKKMQLALESPRKGCKIVMEKDQIEANYNTAKHGGTIFSSIWSVLKGLFSKAAAASPSVAKAVGRKVVTVAPDIAKAVAVAGAEKAAEKIADKIIGEGLEVMIASRAAGNTGLEDEIKAEEKKKRKRKVN